MANTTNELLFGVKGGGSLSGASGRQIEADLKAIVARLEAKGSTKLTFGADTAGLQAAARALANSVAQVAQAGQQAGAALDLNIQKQETLNRLLTQQASLQRSAGQAMAAGGGAAASSGSSGIGSALTGVMQTISNAVINQIVNDSMDQIRSSVTSQKSNSVGRLKETGHVNMPTHAPAATRSERAA